MRPTAGAMLAALSLAISLAISLAMCGTGAAEPAKPRQGKPAAAAAAVNGRECARASYPGDPVCAWEDDGGNLPTPSARAVRQQVPDDVIINDALSVSGADPVAMAKPPVQSANPYPVRKKEAVGGGAAVNYRF